MNGTEWTEPGQGATVTELYSACCHAEDAGLDTEPACRPLLGRVNGSLKAGSRTRTNLRLTGSPLTAYDLKRIEQCEVVR